MSAVMQVEGLSFSYPGCPLFAQWRASVPAGVSCIAGGDGAGKTTLLRLLAGDLALQGGDVCISPPEAGSISLSKDRASYVREVFWVDPRDPAFDQLLPSEVFDQMALRYPLFNRRLMGPLMEGLFLTEHAHKKLFMLSTGSRRKVLLAAAFASGATVLLLDSPFAALDKPSIRVVKECLNDFAELPDKACVVADYEAPDGIALAASFDLG
ncbi:MAG: ABC-F family ATP-binding cassette domain-containing protein [Betaproteobacteria bacterium]|nr:ABC-F family ATP-binding cassette domain-containing protein [Betaproteobacteria bacterium]MBP6646273.1 ABC-F family ATP-binding cassette domain-containing protein [Burkholderiaceae bacterium]